MFIVVVSDVFRRQLSGWAKAGWIFLIIILPFIGVLAYLVARPATESRDVIAWGPSAPQAAADYRPADEIAKAAQLQDDGRISAAEFEQIKARVLAR
jgi:hypothetical protein